MKNYTSQVPVAHTIMKIETILARAGASDILKNYENGEIVAVCFTIMNKYSGRKQAIKLPANVAAVEKVFREAVKRPRAGSLLRIRDQAARTAWKIIQEWIEIQISLIEMGQAEMLQVFLPYLWDGKKMLFHSLRDTGFKMLDAHREGDRS